MNYQEIKQRQFEINRSLRFGNGLYAASAGEHYRKYCWWRDIFYQSLPNLKNDPGKYIQTYHTFLDFLHKYEWKMDNLIQNPESYNCDTCLHIKVFPDLEPIDQEWGMLQMDAICLMLLGIGLGLDQQLSIVRSSGDKQVVQKAIRMYEALEYWHLAGNDAWEEDNEIHSHAIGATLAAFKKLFNHGWCVNMVHLQNCQDELNSLLPRESVTKDCDLAQLQLIFPLNIVSDEQRDQILHNIETNLVRDRGVARYRGDLYYNIGSKWSYDTFGGVNNTRWTEWNNELQWAFGFAYLSIIHSQLGDNEKAKYYLDKLLDDAGDDMLIPEGYFAMTKIKNDNTPLGWATALTIVAIDNLI